MTGVRRLVGLGSIVVDLVLHVPRLPERGGDVLASTWRTEVGGGLHALRAATAGGLSSAYGGGHGTGPFGDLVRGALASLGIAPLLAPTPGQDTGFCVVLVDDTGERTFATTVGAEGRLTAGQLADLALEPGDAAYVSGYDLAYPHGAVLAAAVEQLPGGTVVAFDPGPLVAQLDGSLVDRVLARSTWLSLNAREAEAWTSSDDPSGAAHRLLGRHPGLSGVVLRLGANGCLVALRGAAAAHVAAVPVQRVVDTTGAGDVHVGAFLAALAHGHDPVDAAARANAAAAEQVGR